MEHKEKLFTSGASSDGVHEITVNDSVVKVRDLETGYLVAFSSIETDFAQSVDEFLGDFFPKSSK